ncbi:hypothetical protein TWF788_006699 [Orbilia oligospora]|uniref:Uncharacterized protein n=1 Tax=Orbilia oligospora TaxID=2813651 RepID=A0A7C8PV00_ORBOL|nr:hypothetical protein TWF788_006699 [Orbilia oligospora]
MSRIPSQLTTIGPMVFPSLPWRISKPASSSDTSSGFGSGSGSSGSPTVMVTAFIWDVYCHKSVEKKLEAFRDKVDVRVGALEKEMTGVSKSLERVEKKLDKWWWQ